MMPTCHDVRGLVRAMKALYYGDNLQVLRDSIATESVDLIYLDPPFNSNAAYNVGLLGVQRMAPGDGSFSRL